MLTEPKTKTVEFHGKQVTLVSKTVDFLEDEKYVPPEQLKVEPIKEVPEDIVGKFGPYDEKATKESARRIAEMIKL